MDDFFRSYHRHRPVNATFVGVHDHDHLLPDLSESGAGDTLAEMRDLTDRLDDLTVRLRAPHAPDASRGDTVRGAAAAGQGEALSAGHGEAPSAMSAAERVDQRLARGFLEIQQWEYGSNHFHRGNPSYHTGEAVFSVLGLFLTDFAPFSERFEAARARIDAIPGFLEVARDVGREAPGAWTERAIRECEGGIALLTDGMATLASEHSVSDSRFETLCRDAASAFAEHRSWLQTDVRTPSTERIACGPEALDRYLKVGHFLDRSADEISRYALAQMDEAEARVAEALPGFDASSPDDVMARLARLHPTADGYLDAFEATWQEMKALAESNDLVTWPDFPIRYIERPEWTRAAAPFLYFLFYRSPAAQNRPPVHDYLVAPRPDSGIEDFLEANNDSVIKLNHVVHHGGLGHHVQNWNAFRAESRIGRMAAVDCASRIAMFCGATMAEGWACYATDLAGEFGGLTKLEHFAETRGRIRMAARAFVDVEMHSGRMTLEEAAAVYRERAGMPEAAARAEAVKNSMFPGAALIYLMGRDAIHDLRAEVALRQGSDFSLRAFHDAFLAHGSIPVSLIAETMKDTLDAE